MEKNVSEGNKLIAEFLGWEWRLSSIHFYGNADGELWQWNVPENDPLYNKAHCNQELWFHSSWDWLIQVVVRIYALNAPCDEFRMVQSMTNTLVIEAAWQAVVDFIKWYNQNKPNEK